MEKKIADILKKNESNLIDWLDKINDFNRMNESISNYSEEEHIEITYGASETLGKISDLFLNYGTFKDSFDRSKMYLHFEGPSLQIVSEKIQTTIYFGIDKDGYYLNTQLRNPENLRYMGDDFYQSIFLLSELGNFDINEIESMGKQNKDKYGELFNTGKSKLFRLLRSYIIGAIENPGDVYLGDFRICWDYNTNFEKIIINSCQAFKILYKLNYDLWKVSNLKKTK